MKHGNIFLIIILLSCTLNAQNIIPRFENIGVNEGLSQSSVYSIYQDKKGFMWFGTADGLNRYDGQNIKIYKICDKKIANSNFVRGNICEDSKGNIWFCNETGLYCYNPLDDKLLRKVVFKKLRWATGIFIDKNDKFFLLHPGLGIYEFDTNTYQIILTACRFKTPYYTYVSEYSATNSRNTIWIKAPYANEILVYNTQNRTVKYLKTIIKFKSIFYAGYGKLYMGNKTGNFTITDTSLHLIDKITYTSKTKSLLEIRILHIDNYNRLWISTIDNGLMCYNEITKTFTHYLHNNSKVKSLPVNIISSLYIDRANNLWIGTDGGGVSKLDLKPPKFNLFPLNEGDYPFLKDYFIKCFYEDDDGKIWFGTHSSGFNIYNPKTGDVKNYNIQPAKSKGLPGSVISGIFKSKRGSIWIATSMGICSFNKNSNTFTTIKITDGPKLNEHNNFVYKIIDVDNGDMVAATYFGLMVIKKINGVFTGIFGKPNPAGNILVTDVVEMDDHSFWASSPLYGIIHYKRLGNDFVILEKQLPLIDLRSIHKDEKNGNVLWVCTGIGLIKYNTLTRGQTLYNEKNGMANSYVYGVLEDEQHNFWMSTNMGICFFNRKENTFQNFTANDGLQSNEFNTQSFYKGKSGNIYFGGIHGFNWFKPETIKNTAITVPGVAITSILVDDKPYIKDKLYVQNKTIALRYNQNNVTFQFAALDFTRPQANKVKFILEGWDKTWITSTDKNFRYSHLAPGSYLLKVKAANSDGLWSKEEKLILIVNAPFWLRTWFYFWMGIGLMICIVYITYFVSQQKIRKRLRLLEKQHAIEAERNRISRDMHDEIGSGLTHIALLSELIQTQQKTEREFRNDIGSISTAARKLVESMSEIIWALNPQNDSLENLLSYIREQMQQHFEPFKILLKIDFPYEVQDIKLSNEQRRNLYLVTKEALNNVMKHACASNVTLFMCPVLNKLNFEVNDDGRGLSDKKGRAIGNGLKNMRKRMEDIIGTIEWINSKKGLKVIYSLSIKV